jgi:hypothetical protein
MSARRFRLERLYSMLPPDDALWLEAQLEGAAPWENRARRLALRDEALRGLAAACANNANSGRAAAVRAALVRYSEDAWRFERDRVPAGDRVRALPHRVLTLTGGKAPSTGTVRRALAGVAPGSKSAALLSQNVCDGESVESSGAVLEAASRRETTDCGQ